KFSTLSLHDALPIFSIRHGLTACNVCRAGSGDLFLFRSYFLTPTAWNSQQRNMAVLQWDEAGPPSPSLTTTASCIAAAHRDLSRSEEHTSELQSRSE